MASRKPEVLDEETIRDIVRGEEVAARNEFVRRHKKQLEEAVRRAHRVHALFQERHPEWGQVDRRRMMVAFMIHMSLNNVLTSLALLSSGYPGGHLKIPHPWPGQTPPPDEGGTRVRGCYAVDERFATRAAAFFRRQLLPSNFSRCP